MPHRKTLRMRQILSGSQTQLWFWNHLCKPAALSTELCGANSVCSGYHPPGGIHGDTMAELCLLHVVQIRSHVPNYIKMISNFVNILLKQTGTHLTSWVQYLLYLARLKVRRICSICCWISFSLEKWSSKHILSTLISPSLTVWDFSQGDTKNAVAWHSFTKKNKRNSHKTPTVSQSSYWMNWQYDIIISVKPLNWMMILNLLAQASPTESQNSFTYHRKRVTSCSANHRLLLDGCQICLGIFCLTTKPTTKPCDLVPISYWYHCHIFKYFLAHICKFTVCNWYLIYNMKHKPKNTYFACLLNQR